MMTPESALDLLNQLRLEIPMKGKDHETARQAHEFLANWIKEQKEAVQKLVGQTAPVAAPAT